MNLTFDVEVEVEFDCEDDRIETDIESKCVKTKKQMPKRNRSTEHTAGGKEVRVQRTVIAIVFRVDVLQSDVDN